MDMTGELAAWIVGVGAAVAVLVKLFLWTRTRYRTVKRNAVRAWGDVFGRDEVRHPSTGEVLLPATQSIGARLEGVERTQLHIAEALQSLASMEHRLDEHIEQRELWSRDVEREIDHERQERHALERRVVSVEQAVAAERILSKHESIQLLQTIEQVAKTEPPPEVE